MPQIDFYLIARTDPSAPGPGPRHQRTVLHQKGHLQGTLLDFGGRFALEPPRGNQHRQAARARLATEKPAVLRRHIPVWPVRAKLPHAAFQRPSARRLLDGHVVSVYRDAPGYQVNTGFWKAERKSKTTD